MQQLLLATTNVVVGARLGLLGDDDPAHADKALVFELDNAGGEAPRGVGGGREEVGREGEWDGSVR